MKPFTEKVREHRGQLGLSQQELADKAGIGVRTLTYYECGKRFPQAAQLSQPFQSSSAVPFQLSA